MEQVREKQKDGREEKENEVRRMNKRRYGGRGREGRSNRGEEKGEETTEGKMRGRLKKKNEGEDEEGK